MEFCETDGTLLKLKCNDGYTAYECKMCGFKKSYDGNVMYSTNTNNIDNFACLFINYYSKFDYCLKVDTNFCNNCNDNSQFVYYQHDKYNMRGLYMCKTCNTVYTKDKNKTMKELYQINC